MQNLIAAVNASIDPAALIRRIAEQMLLLTPKADGAAVSILTSHDEFLVVSAHGLVESLLGLTLRRESTYMNRAITTGRPQYSPETSEDPLLTEQIRDIGVRLGIHSLVVIPLSHRGEAIGALSMTAAAAHRFTERDIAAMEAVGRFVSGLIGSHTELSAQLDDFLNDPHIDEDDSAPAKFLASMLLPEMARDEEMHHQLDALLARPSALTAVVQPIVDLGTGTVVGWEGLSRFPDNRDLTPQHWFEIARRIGRSLPLELAAIERVLAASTALPGEHFVAVNVSPVTAMDPEVQSTLLRAQRPLVVEITEHEPFPDTLAEALVPLREHGIRLAIDDAGAGFASFEQLLRLRPDIIKIDGALTGGIENDPVRRALASAIVALAEEMKATTVAEAVENPRQMAALRRLGVHLGQGYLFGRPAAAPVRGGGGI
ncbi:EAL domain-containing protein [Mycobacterium sp. WMMD1722]|uniref:sensor domain-containing phosphodiesterase n=1 Tax=Mycobacterium sp. WMMD1722 TaxID=3404117 RepID=UPI003BF5034F